MEFRALIGYWWFLPAVTALSLVLTLVLRRYAMVRRLIDTPNVRSSHSVPTPRGGGVAIVLTFLAALAVVSVFDVVSSAHVWAVVVGGGVVALIGFLDDHSHIAARWRLLVHFAGAFWVLAVLGGVPPLVLFGKQVTLGGGGVVLAAVYLVWLLNLYNFMDGIDGIASVEAICVCLGGALLFVLNGHAGLAALPVLLAAAVAGFLWWNFPPAKIFMGDAGSGFLGIVLGIFSLQAAWVSPDLFWSWLILLGVFIVDATWTLLRRLLLGKRIYEAHRSHAYQHAARRCGRHLPVTLFVGATNLFWLLPLAVAVGTGRVGGLPGIGLAYAPLLVLALVLHAGEEDGSAA